MTFVVLEPDVRRIWAAPQEARTTGPRYTR